MSAIRLIASQLIDPETQANYAIHSIRELSTQNHDHDFYEVFLIIEGMVWHEINGQSILLHKGTLVFIRPHDRHYYRRYKNEECSLINIAVYAASIHALLDYLDTEDYKIQFIQPIMPPSIQLTPKDTHDLYLRLSSLSELFPQSKEAMRRAIKSLLVDLFVHYFFANSSDQLMSAPLWLREVCNMMQETEHFIAGRDALLQLSNRSAEHVGRAFKKYLNTTPSHYINTLRLNYAANLLIHTDQAIIDIAFGCGFDNLSYFYQQFKKRFNITPSRYRSEHSRHFVP